MRERKMRDWVAFVTVPRFPVLHNFRRVPVTAAVRPELVRDSSPEKAAISLTDACLVFFWRLPEPANTSVRPPKHLVSPLSTPFHF